MSSVLERSPSDDWQEESLRPREWGVVDDCFVRLHEPDSRETRLLAHVGAGQSVSWRHGDAEAPLLLTFHRATPERRPAERLGTVHRWTPQHLRSTREPGEGSQGALGVAEHRDVVLTPYVPASLGAGMLKTKGYVGAWNDAQPIPEILDFALGRQYYRFHPVVSEAREIDGTAIYVGPPQPTWGHFLTQGLSRIWYALQHPDVPILWDGPTLEPFQREVLELLGVQNESLFLTGPQRWSTVVFPHPGVCIGDFVEPRFAEMIGRVPAPAVVAGRRIFLSRSALPVAISPEERQLDAIARDHGFEIVHPESMPVRQQLEKLGSAEVVLGVEGSAFHSVLLLRGAVGTQFWALARHRGGSGIFEHIRAAKHLDYRTLNFLPDRVLVGHATPLSLDVRAIEDLLRRTNGLRDVRDDTAMPLDHAWPGQSSYDTLLRHAQIHPAGFEDAIAEVHMQLLRTQPELAQQLGSTL